VIETRSLVVVLEHIWNLLTEGNQLEQATLRDREIKSLNELYCWIPAKFSENSRRKKHLRERRLQCPKPRANPVEELENRLGAKNGVTT
jgi:hypothetical protein